MGEKCRFKVSIIYYNIISCKSSVLAHDESG